MIKLKKNDPIVQRAKALDTIELTEVGFIPGDECGCKIYARQLSTGYPMMIGVHSRTYGCLKDPKTVGVEIENFHEQLAFAFGDI